MTFCENRYNAKFFKVKSYLITIFVSTKHLHLLGLLCYYQVFSGKSALFYLLSFVSSCSSVHYSFLKHWVSTTKDWQGDTIWLTLKHYLTNLQSVLLCYLNNKQLLGVECVEYRKLICNILRWFFHQHFKFFHHIRLTLCWKAYICMSFAYLGSVRRLHFL